MTPNPNPAMVSIADQDLVLVEASKRGDDVAFEELVRRYDRTLLRVAQVVTQSLEMAQEVVQVAFVKAFHNLGGFPGNTKLSTWLIQIALNESLMRLRMQSATREEPLENASRGQDSENMFASEETPIMNATRWVPSFDGLYTKAELRDILMKSLRSLPPSLRLIFVLRDIDGYSIADTAEILRLTPAAVQTRLSRARMQLRQELNPYFKV